MGRRREERKQVMRRTVKQMAALLLALVLLLALAPGGALAAGGAAGASSKETTARPKGTVPAPLAITLPGQSSAVSAPAGQLRQAAALSDLEQRILERLQALILETSSGNRLSTDYEITVAELGLADRKWTAADLGVSEILTDDAISPAAVEALTAAVSYDLTQIINVLLPANPFDLYWYDKTVGINSTGFTINAEYDDAKGEYILFLSGSVHFAFTVSADYSAGDYLVDAACVQNALAAKAQAQEIVDRYAGRSDYGILQSYLQEICALTSYNQEAADGSRAYGDPWQPVWVFDRDPSTTVVCEGYAKAFQYLCDLTEFSGGVSCLTVTGVMSGGTGAGAHSWNIVGMDDGKYYLVDVTNCDEGTIGAPDLLFLAGADRRADDTYCVACDSGEIIYTYSSDTIQLHTGGELEISAAAYAPAAETYVENGITYSLAAGEATVIAYGGTAKDLTIPGTVKGCPVVAIGERAFMNNSVLESVTFPASVERVADGALLGEIINDEWIDGGSYGAFFNCTALKRVVIPADSRLSYLGGCSFYKCVSLTSITLPASIRTLGLSCFEGCAALTELELPEGLEAFGQNVISDTSITALALPASLISFNISNYPLLLEEITVAPENPYYQSFDDALYQSFDGKWYLVFYPWAKKDATYRIPDFADDYYYGFDSLIGKDQGDGKFVPHPYLKTIDIGNHQIRFPGSLLLDILMDPDNPYYTLEGGILYDKEMTTVLAIPRSITGEVRIPEGVTTIGEQAGWLSQFSSIVFPSSINRFEDEAFSRNSALTHIEFPDATEYMGKNLLEGCVSLTSCTLPKSISKINEGTFSCCYGFRSFTIPDQITEIGASAFHTCSYLETLYLPKSIQYIDSSAFSQCFGLQEVFYEGTPADWRKIAADAEGDPYRCLTRRIIHFNNDVDAIGGACGDDLTWTLTNGKMEILGSGAMYDYEYWEAIPWYPYRDDILEMTIPAGVTHIGDNTFLECAGITELKYSGTKAQWIALTAGQDLSSATFRCICSDGTIPARLGTFLNPVALECGVVGRAEFSDSSAWFTFSFTAPFTGDYAFCSVNGAHFNYRWFDPNDSGSKFSLWMTQETPDGVLFEKHLVGGTAYTLMLSSYDGTQEPLTILVRAASPVTITTQPQDVTAEEGSTVKFAVKADGADLTYQWQYSTDGGETWENSLATGNNTATLTVPATADGNGYKYRCIVKSGNSEVTSDAATLTVSTNTAPTITTQPQDVTAEEGSTAKFTVKANGADLTYQWQYSADGGKTWKAASATGNNTATLTVPATADGNGYKYRCVIQSGNSEVISDAATLTVSADTAPTITTQPQNVTVAAGGTAKFTVKASGSDLSYQWQYSTDAGKTWKASPATGNKTATLSVPATASKSGYKYRCVVKSGTAKVTSQATTLTVKAAAKPTITTQPKNVTVAAGGTAKFTVKASGSNLTYQWQYSTNGGKTWKASPATGNKTATLKISATASKSGYKYRCVVKSGTAKVTSKAVTLTVSAGTKPTITTQPKNVTVAAGGTAKFTVKASGTNLTYQWQYSTDGGKTWKNSPATGNKTATLKISATASKSGYKYRCVVKSGTAKVTSKAVTLTVSAGTKPTITTQPKDVTVAAGSTAQFTVKASGSNLTYQWQYSTNGGKTWKASPATGSKTATLKISATASKSGYKYRCVVKSGTAKVTSKAVTLTVSAGTKPTITTQPKNVTVAAGGTAKFTVKASGSNLTYQWQYSTNGGKTWQNSPATGNKTATLKISATASKSGYKYRCIVKSGTAKVTSKAVTLTVTG